MGHGKAINKYPENEPAKKSKAEQTTDKYIVVENQLIPDNKKQQQQKNTSTHFMDCL